MNARMRDIDSQTQRRGRTELYGWYAVSIKIAAWIESRFGRVKSAAVIRQAKPRDYTWLRPSFEMTGAGTLWVVGARRVSLAATENQCPGAAKGPNKRLKHAVLHEPSTWKNTAAGRTTHGRTSNRPVSIDGSSTSP